MENKTGFDLVTAFAGWRQNLAMQPGMTLDHARELESHLREAVSELQQRGLSEEEAFLVACRRIGPGEKIASEYAKADPARLWRERVYWMAVGILGSSIFSALVGILQNAIVNQFARPVDNWSFGMRAAIDVLMWVLMAGGAIYFAQRKIEGSLHHKLESWVAQDRLALWLFGVFVGLTGLTWLSLWIRSQLEHSFGFSFSLGNGVYLLAALVKPLLIAGIIWRLSPQKSSPASRIRA